MNIRKYVTDVHGHTSVPVAKQPRTDAFLRPKLCWDQKRGRPLATSRVQIVDSTVLHEKTRLICFSNNPARLSRITATSGWSCPWAFSSIARVRWHRRSASSLMPFQGRDHRHGGGRNTDSSKTNTRLRRSKALRAFRQRGTDIAAQSNDKRGHSSGVAGATCTIKHPRHLLQTTQDRYFPRISPTLVPNSPHPLTTRSLPVMDSTDSHAEKGSPEPPTTLTGCKEYESLQNGPPRTPCLTDRQDSLVQTIGILALAFRKQGPSSTRRERQQQPQLRRRQQSTTIRQYRSKIWRGLRLD